LFQRRTSSGTGCCSSIEIIRLVLAVIVSSTLPLSAAWPVGRSWYQHVFRKHFLIGAIGKSSMKNTSVNRPVPDRTAFLRVRRQQWAMRQALTVPSSGAIILLLQPRDDGLDMYTESLRDHGLAVIAVSDPQAALRAAPKAHVIVTGILLAGSMDGVELIARLRHDERTHRTPIIVLTACAWTTQPDVMDAVQVMRQRAQAAGALKTTPQQAVTTQRSSIVVEPARPDVVYVPAYDPWSVYGDPLEAWPGWYPYPGIWYGGPYLSFGSGFGIGFFGRFGWGWPHWGVDWRNRFAMYNNSRYYSRSTTFYNRSAFYRGGGPRGGVNNRADSTARPFNGNTRAARGYAEPRGQSGVRTGAFSGYQRGGQARGFSSRGRGSFGGGAARGGGGSRGGGRGRR
jgi:CheY-like chemotaxis protein